jgi:small-conductance mechanosensitive channel
MQDSIPEPINIFWAISTILGFPLLMVVLGEITEHLERRKNAFAQPLKNFRNLFLPLLVLYVILTRLANLDSTNVVVRIIQTAFWIALIYTALSILNTLLFANARANSWQAKIPKLFVDVSRSILVLVGIAIILSTVWGANLANIIAALGFGSFALAFALQNVVGNIFSGLMLTVEQPFALNEWIEVGDVRGKVAQINWRSVHLETPSGDLVIIPNSEIAGNSFTNLSRPKPIYEKEISISFSYDDPPRKVVQLLRETAMKAPHVIPESVWVRLSSYGDFAINYTIGLSAPTMSQSVLMHGEFMMRLWYVAKRNNLNMPYPIAANIEYTVSALTPQEQTAQITNLLREIPSLSRLDPRVLEKIVEIGHVLDYCGGEVIIPLDSPLEGLYFIVAGEVQLTTPNLGAVELANGANSRLILGQLSKGEFFGEQACLMTEQLSDFVALALTDVQLFMVDRTDLERILNESPRLAQQIAEVMEVRRRTSSQLKLSKAA